MTDRNQAIIRTSTVGIAVNMLLVVFKAIVGFVAGSIAIVMDAVNNLSDVLSSVITIVGTRLSAKPADKEHPFWSWPHRIFLSYSYSCSRACCGYFITYRKH